MNSMIPWMRVPRPPRRRARRRAKSSCLRRQHQHLSRIAREALLFSSLPLPLRIYPSSWTSSFFSCFSASDIVVQRPQGSTRSRYAPGLAAKLRGLTIVHRFVLGGIPRTQTGLPPVSTLLPRRPKNLRPSSAPSRVSSSTPESGSSVAGGLCDRLSVPSE